jgi:hypothetical protein
MKRMRVNAVVPDTDLPAYFTGGLATIPEGRASILRDD